MKGMRSVLFGLAVACAPGVLVSNPAMAAAFICSPLEGWLVDTAGTPVVGVEVRRHWSWRGKTGRDVTTTDPHGRFSFDGVPARRSLLDRLPAEEAVVQRYFAETADGPFEFLFISSRGLSSHREADGRTPTVVCLIGAPQGFGGFHWGTCSRTP